MNGQFVTTRVARTTLNVNSSTLREWADNGLIKSIRTPGGTRLYDVNEYIQRFQQQPKEENKVSICYCRVSSNGQKEDLKRQVSKMQQEYPNHRIITDIGSGINFKRQGLKTILELTFARQLEEVVVSYRDRLCRFAFELLEWIFHQHGVKLLVLDSNMDSSTNSELAEDLLAIVNVFNCRVNGRRKYKIKKEDSNGENKENDNVNTKHNEENKVETKPGDK
jgi:predicted site-specific integrase-resolvase